MTRTIKAGLIGENISRSRFSTALEFLCQQADINWEFTLFDTTAMPNFHFDDHIDQLITEGFDGITVTHPYKTRADRRADRQVEYPAILGASNLLKFGDEITSFNTDYLGFKAAWRDVFGTQKPGKIAMAGAGGVARAIVVALRDLGVERIDIWDSKPGAAAMLQTQIDPDNTFLHTITCRPETTVRAADGLVNATPLGMKAYPGSAIPADWIGTQKWAFDAVYTPIETPFMRAVQSAGLHRLSGFDLFKHMAINSFTAYSGVNMAAEDAALLNHLANDL